MSINERRKKLNQLMHDNKLTPIDVANLLDRSVISVYGWRSNKPIPEHSLELLESKITEMKTTV